MMVAAAVAVNASLCCFRLIWLVLISVLLVSGCGGEPEPASKRTFTIGLITNNPNGMRNVQGFRDGLRALGYVEGKTVTYLDSGKPVPKPELVAAIQALLAEGAELIFTAGTPTGVAAKEATRSSEVPVIFGVIADPIAAGVMTDLIRPGHNMTGVMLSENQARRLELFQMVAPEIRRVLVPYNPDDAAPISAVVQIEGVAAAMGLELIHAKARNDDEVTTMLAEIPPDVDAMFMLPDSTVNRRAKDLLALAVARKIPVSGPSQAQVEDGALMAYGIVHHEVGVQAARIAHRILRGADPATTPVETADFFLTINVAAAERIGRTLPEEILQQADLIVRSDRFGQ